MKNFSNGITDTGIKPITDKLGGADNCYLIVAGTTKSGTGSLYNYLADHPELCGSNIKETRFFFDQEFYYLPAKYTFARDISPYSIFFTHCKGTKIKLEATPDYLYSPTTPAIVKKALKNVKFLFILREPVERLVSWYRFAKQQRLIDGRICFDKYINTQFDIGDRHLDKTIPQHMRSLEQGRYSKYLNYYFDSIERNRIFIAGYSELKGNKKLLLSNIADYLGVDEAFYQNYRYGFYNRTWTMRSTWIHRIYVLFRRNVRMRTHHNPTIWITLKRLRRQFEPIYLRVNTKEDEKTIISSEMREKLTEYYRDELSNICNLIRNPDFLY